MSVSESESVISSVISNDNIVLLKRTESKSIDS